MLKVTANVNKCYTDRSNQKLEAAQGWIAQPAAGEGGYG